MDLSIVIVSWNTCELLDQCLASIFDYPPSGDYDVWVVDNASTDDSAHMVRERYSRVNLIESKANLGFATANNQAIHYCRGRYVLLLNPDTTVKPAALERLVAFMDAHPRVGAAGSRLLNPDDTLQVSCHPEPTLSRELWRLFHLDKLYPYAQYPVETWDLNTPQVVDVIQGASLILRQDALEQVGLLDEQYFIYSEEVDLCYRIKKAGWKIYWVPSAEVVHYGGQSTQQVASEMFLRLYQGKLLYFRKHHGRLAALIYKLILAAASLARIAISPFAWLEAPHHREQHLVLSSNYKRLLAELPGM